MAAGSWQAQADVEYVDVVAEREGRRLYAEAKGKTAQPGLDVHTAAGQLLSRMSVQDDPAARYALVVRDEPRSVRASACPRACWSCCGSRCTPSPTTALCGNWAAARSRARPSAASRASGTCRPPCFLVLDSGMTQPWREREGKMLGVLAERFSEPKTQRVYVGELAKETGMSEEEVRHQFNRLAQSEFIDVERGFVGITAVKAVLSKGWQVTTGEPNELGASVDVIVGRLEAEMERETDPKRRGAWAALATAVRNFSLEFGPKLSAELLAKALKLE